MLITFEEGNDKYSIKSDNEGGYYVVGSFDDLDQINKVLSFFGRHGFTAMFDIYVSADSKKIYAQNGDAWVQAYGVSKEEFLKPFEEEEEEVEEEPVQPKKEVQRPVLDYDSYEKGDLRFALMNAANFVDEELQQDWKDSVDFLITNSKFSRGAVVEAIDAFRLIDELKMNYSQDDAVELSKHILFGIPEVDKNNVLYLLAAFKPSVIEILDKTTLSKEVNYKIAELNRKALMIQADD